MTMRKRVLSLLLAFAMCVSLVPAGVSATPNKYDADVDAKFLNANDVRTGVSGQEVVLSMDLVGVDEFSTIRWNLDMASSGLKDYVHLMEESFTANRTMRIYPTVYLSTDPIEIHENIGSGKNVADTDGVLEVTMTLDSDIPAGYYDVPIVCKELTYSTTDLAGKYPIEAGSAYIVKDDDPSSYIKSVARLTVCKENGDLPDAPTEPTLYSTTAVVVSDPTSGHETGEVAISKTPCEAGETVTVTLKPSTGYKLSDAANGLSAVTTTSGQTVKLTATGIPGKYTFTMPAENVTLTANYTLFEVDDTHDTAYQIRVASTQNGTIHLNGVTAANAGDIVTLYVTPDEGYSVLDVAVTAMTGTAVQVDGGTKQPGSGAAYLYTFTMPASEVTAGATFRATNDDHGPETDPDVANGFLRVSGTVLTSNNRPLPGAVVVLGYANGDRKGTEAARTVTAADGSYTLKDVPNQYQYTVIAKYDTGIQQGREVTPGYEDVSREYMIQGSTTDTTNKGESIKQTLTITLMYEWDVDDTEDADGGKTVEKIFAGADDEFLTPDDFYQVRIGTKNVLVDVYADASGQIRSTVAYYKWEINTDGVKEQVFVGDGFKPGTPNDYYLMDVDFNPATADVRVQIGEDCTPATSDDFFELDVNGDGKIDKVFAGADGLIRTEDDWYQDGSTVIFAGKDKIAGTPDDWYKTDADGHGDQDVVYVGRDCLACTEHNSTDDYYQRDVDGDGDLENLICGDDGRFNTADDYYDARIPYGDSTGAAVKVFIGSPGEGGDPYEFGKRNDHYGWTVGGKAVDVRVGDDKTAGTDDDEYDWTIQDDDDGPADVVVIAGEDGTPGTPDDYYMYDADNDGTDEKIFIGEDRKPGTADDHYFKDVNGDGSDEQVFAGEDEKFDTPDDHYPDTIKNAAGGMTDIDVFADKDGHIGSSDDMYAWSFKFDNGDPATRSVHVGDDLQAGTSDDYYNIEIKDDDDGPVTVTVIAGEDGVPGTTDDYYDYDADNDGELERIHVGNDTKPGTADDFYYKDVNGDGEDEQVFAGADEMFDTPDDHYPDTMKDENGNDVAIDVRADADGHIGTSDDSYDWAFKFDDGDPATRPVHVGDDKQAGTADDYYEYDANKDGMPEKIYAGEGRVPGTPDDHYYINADEDPDLEDVFVGADRKPGTADDYYDEDVNGDGKPERVYAGADEAFKTLDDYYEAIVNTPDGGKETKPVYAGQDTIFSDPKADPKSDDWYPWDTNEDGSTNPDVYGGDTTDKVFIDGDSLAGTDDDYYYRDVDGDGEKETVYVGGDGIPNTEDDYYYKDINGDGKPEQIFPGEDNKFNTGDDYYVIPDQDGDGEEEKVFKGDDGKFGTPDDWYMSDIDKEGEKEKVYVGDDKIAGTTDDWYYPHITFDGNGGLIDGKTRYRVLRSEIKELPCATRSGSYRFDGFKINGAGKSLTLEEVLALKLDTVIKAAWTYTGGSGGGGGGGGGGSVPTCKVTLMADGKTIKVITVASGKALSASQAEIPAKEGFKGTGWFTDKDLKNAFDLTKTITKDMTLYAGYEKAEAEEPAKHVDPEINQNVAELMQVYPHVAYISGYPDATVRPNGNITRAEAAMIFYRLLNEKTRKANDTTSCAFSDVPANAWYRGAVATLAKLGILDGKGGNKFEPNANMTRAEFATVCARIGKLQATGKSKFVDVPSAYWASKYILAAADCGWVVGFGDGKFQPNAAITRAQVVTIMNRVLGRTPKSVASFAGLKYNDWKDNGKNAWYYVQIVEAGTSHDCEFDAASAETWVSLIDGSKPAEAPKAEDKADASKTDGKDAGKAEDKKDEAKADTSKTETKAEDKKDSKTEPKDGGDASKDEGKDEGKTANKPFKKKS